MTRTLKIVGVSPEEVPEVSALKRHWRHVCTTTGQDHSWTAAVHSVVRAYRHDGRATCPICKLRNMKDKKEWHKVKQSRQDDLSVRGPHLMSCNFCQSEADHNIP